MPAHRRYTKGEKAKVVALASMTTVEAAADQTGIPRTTIDYWMDRPEFVELRNNSSDQVAEEFWSAIQTVVKRIVELIPLTEDIAKVGVAVGILYDKRALLTGGATGRTESRDLTGTISDIDIVAAVREAEALTSGSDHGSEAESQEPAAG